MLSASTGEAESVVTEWDAVFPRCRYYIFVYIHILHESPNSTVEKGRGQEEQERIIGAYVQGT